MILLFPTKQSVREALQPRWETFGDSLSEHLPQGLKSTAAPTGNKEVGTERGSTSHLPGFFLLRSSLSCEDCSGNATDHRDHRDSWRSNFPAWVQLWPVGKLHPMGNFCPDPPSHGQFVLWKQNKTKNLIFVLFCFHKNKPKWKSYNIKLTILKWKTQWIFFFLKMYCQPCVSNSKLQKPCPCEADSPPALSPGPGSYQPVLYFCGFTCSAYFLSVESHNVWCLLSCSICSEFIHMLVSFCEQENQTRRRISYFTLLCLNNISLWIYCPRYLIYLWWVGLFHSLGTRNNPDIHTLVWFTCF